MLGTDYPFPLGEHFPGSLIESVEEFDQTLKVFIFLLKILHHLSNKFQLNSKEKLLYENALKFLNVDHSRFAK